MITGIEPFNKKYFFTFNPIDIKNEEKNNLTISPSISPDSRIENNFNNIKFFPQNIISEKIDLLYIDEEKNENEELFFIKKQIFTDNKIEPLPSTDSQSKNNNNNNLLNLLKKKKTKRKNSHTKFEKDNAMRKINIHYISFIVKFVNFNIKKLISKNHPLFSNLCYNFKQKLNNNNFNELKNKTIGEVLKNEGSNKNKRNVVFYKDHNEKVFDSVYKTILKDLLDINYIEFFRNVYSRISNEKFMDFCKKYKIPKKILFFEDFIQKEVQKDKINGEQYKERLKSLSKSEFISEGYPFFETKEFPKIKGKK